MPVDPSVVVYVDESNRVVAVASNISGDLKVEVVRSMEAYVDESANKPFDSLNPRPQTQVLAMKKG